MKRLILLVFSIWLMLSSFSFAQTEGENYKKISLDFESLYNEDRYEEIFMLFNEDTKKALPLENTKAILGSLKKQLGKIVKREFYEMKDVTYASYKTNFENAVLALDISLDKESKINGLFFKPFVEKKDTSSIKNELNSKGILDEEQIKLIFDNLKPMPKNTQFAMGIIKKGKISFYGAENNGTSINYKDNAQNIFEIGSITKVFTSTLLASMVLDGKIKLDDNVADYLKIPFRNGEKLSFESLANHTSGLPRLPSNLDLTKVNGANPYVDYNSQMLEDYLKNSMELSKEKNYEYSNLAVGLLAYTLAKVEGTTYEKLLDGKIFSKYNMKSSSINKPKDKEKLVRGLDAEGKIVSNWQFDSLAGAGAILSTVEDLSKFLSAQLNEDNKELVLTRKVTYKVNENLDMGLAWHIIKAKDGEKYYFHDGGTGGYTSCAIIDTENMNGFVILTNVSAFNSYSPNISNLSFEMMKTLK